ncbi:MAG: HNH endonuclease [Bacteriovoracaceae bacterium]|nr:HNH endonuclease [Bacteriovoracaceae bacterium]
MDLKHLTDKALLQDTKKFVQKEREVTTVILHHLKEINSRKLFSDLKYASLFEYCVKELGYNESSAFRRIEASKLLKDIPQIEKKIEEGSLTLSNIAKAAQFFKDNNISEVVDKKMILSEVENLSTRECDKKLNSFVNKDEDRRVRISILEKTHIELFELKGFIAKKMNFDELIMYLIKNSKEKIEKDKFKQNSGVSSLSAQKAGRVISASVKREVYIRDMKCVQCGSRFHLNYDHRKPYALGGKSTFENIRLLCFNCNQRSRIKAKL